MNLQELKQGLVDAGINVWGGDLLIESFVEARKRDAEEHLFKPLEFCLLDHHTGHVVSVTLAIKEPTK